MNSVKISSTPIRISFHITQKRQRDNNLVHQNSNPINRENEIKITRAHVRPTKLKNKPHRLARAAVVYIAYSVPLMDRERKVNKWSDYITRAGALHVLYIGLWILISIHQTADRDIYLFARAYFAVRWVNENRAYSIESFQRFVGVSSREMRNLIVYKRCFPSVVKAFIARKRSYEQ